LVLLLVPNGPSLLQKVFDHHREGLDTQSDPSQNSKHAWAITIEQPSYGPKSGLRLIPRFLLRLQLRIRLQQIPALIGRNIVVAHHHISRTIIREVHDGICFGSLRT
jgi:hypothetical protein